MYTVEKLKSKLESIDRLLNPEKFKEINSFLELKTRLAYDIKNILELNKRIIEDIIENYEKGEEYVILQINTFKSVAGITTPLEIAKAAIRLLEEILNGE